MTAYSYSPEKMDESCSGGRSTPSGSAAKPDSDAASETSSVNSGASSERRDVDILAQVLSSRSEEYRLLFRLPHDEVLIQDFNCAFQENILLQGHMYLFIHHICFYSNILGFETKKIIHFREVTCVRKAKTAAIFPNAIEIIVGAKKHFFGSFLSRDEAYRLIVEGWAQHNNDINDFQENQDLKSEASNQDNIVVISREPNAVGDDSSLTKVVNVLEESKILHNGEVDGDVTIKHVEVEENNYEENVKHLSPQNPLTWTVEEVDAPEVPEHFTVVAEAKFPILVEDFFRLFVADGSVGFLEDFHSRCGDKGFQCTPWQQHEKFGHVRDVSFLHPVKVFLGAKFGSCQEMQKFRVYKNSHLMVETAQQISDVPFADHFQVEGIWDVVQHDSGEPSCTLRVYSNVAFLKKTMFRGRIEQSTKDEVREVYALWIIMAHELLKQTRVGQSKVEEVKQSAGIVQANNEVEPEILKNVEGSVENLHPTCSPAEIQRNIHGTRNCRPELMNGVPDSSGCFSTMASMFSASWATFPSFMKAQNRTALVFIATLFSIFILLQMSIVLLLTRVPEVHVVPHGDYARESDRYNMESIEWLEKRFNYLKEEMLTIETRMDRMRHEYAILKSYFQRIEETKAKS